MIANYSAEMKIATFQSIWVLVEIFDIICRFLPSRPKRYRNSLRELCG